jgi:NADH-quinone oxidoreductase subunit M
MILFWLIAILLIAGVLAWAAGRWSPLAARWIALAAASAGLALTIWIWVRHFHQVAPLGSAAWFEEVNWAWIPVWGVHFHLAMDGLSLLLVALTFFLGIVSVLASWREIADGVGFFHLNLLWVLAGIVAVFLSVDLFLFYFAWELMLIPMYFLIAIWGHERRVYAAIKFFLFTQLSSLLMLIAILGLYFAHHAATGVYTFEYTELIGTTLAPSTAMWLMLGFFVAFAVKLPMFPLHTWLPDAHTEAPTAGSIILAGLLLKTGAYGMLRFVVPLFPGAAHRFSPVAMTLGVVGIIYGAILAYGQTDLKRLVAYTSVSHLGFVLLGIFAWNALALQGAVVAMICHGFSTGALFAIAGALQERTHTREMDRLGGLWATIPRFSGAGLFFAMASMGLPGLGDFVGEYLILLGTYREHLGLTIAAVIGVFVSTFYALEFVQRAFHGPNANQWSLKDLLPREVVMLAPMMAALLWLGLYPQLVLDTFRPAMSRLEQTVSQSVGRNGREPGGYVGARPGGRP